MVHIFWWQQTVRLTWKRKSGFVFFWAPVPEGQPWQRSFTCSGEEWMIYCQNNAAYGEVWRRDQSLVVLWVQVFSHISVGSFLSDSLQAVTSNVRHAHFNMTQVLQAETRIVPPDATPPHSDLVSVLDKTNTTNSAACWIVNITAETSRSLTLRRLTLRWFMSTSMLTSLSLM